MILTHTFRKKLKIAFQIRRIQTVTGVNSNLDEWTHIPMWDFDGVSFGEVKRAMECVILEYGLPDIHVFRSKGDEDRFHCYCLKSMSWEQSITVICNTPDVDWVFFKFGVLRGHWTLRISPKDLDIPYPVAIVKGYGGGDVQWKDLASFTQYETGAKGGLIDG